jgi:hypothetical protein
MKMLTEQFEFMRMMHKTLAKRSRAFSRSHMSGLNGAVKDKNNTIGNVKLINTKLFVANMYETLRALELTVPLLNELDLRLASKKLRRGLLVAAVSSLAAEGGVRLACEKLIAELASLLPADLNRT